MRHHTTYFKCKKCGKDLSFQTEDGHYWTQQRGGICAACNFHELNGTDTIIKFNKYLTEPGSMI